MASRALSPAEAIVGMNGGVEHVVAVDGNGNVWNWGDNSNGQLGNGTYASSDQPQQVALPTSVKQVIAGQLFSATLSSDGQHIYAWGDNSSGGLGIGSKTPTQANTPQEVKLSLQPGQSVVSIADGGNGAFALLSNGQVLGWGANEHGQAGQDPAGGNTIVATPTPIAGLSDVTSLSAGDHQTLALKGDGSVWALGGNRFGQLGPNGPPPSMAARTFTPVQVGGLPPIAAIATGGESSYALDRQGHVWSWGRNTFGQLGQGTIDADDGPHPMPKQIAGLSNIVSIDGEGPFTLAADSAGNVYGWGFNQNGEVGNGTLDNTGTPQLVLPAGKLGQPVVVTAGHWFSYAYNPTTGQAYAWGRNSYGELKLPGPKRDNPDPIDLGPLLPVCFTSGTRIRTTRGDIPVERLVVGDLAITAGGARRPIRWIGRRDLRRPQRAIASDVWPVRVLAGAFGGGLPARDLRLSPGHPVLVGADADQEGGHLVPIMCLVNGTTVHREPVETVTYWHVELDAHDILLAEGLPAESYLDWGDRAFFDEGADHALANPDFVVPGLGGRCRPVAVDGPVVEAERRRLDVVFVTRLAAACDWPEAHAELWAWKAD